MSKQRFYAVMKAMAFTSLQTENGIGCRTPSEGPQRFIPVFDTREQAIAFADGDHSLVSIIQEAEQEK